MSAPRTAWRSIACLLALTSGTTQAESALDGATLFKLACQACHALGPDTSRRIGPRLDGIAGRPAAIHALYAALATAVAASFIRRSAMGPASFVNTAK